MHQNQVKNYNLISRFSSLLLGCGKKVEGHKLLFHCFFILRSNTEKELLNLNLQKKMLNNWSDNNVFLFLFSIGFSQKALQNFINRKIKQPSFSSFSKKETSLNMLPSFSPSPELEIVATTFDKNIAQSEVSMKIEKQKNDYNTDVLPKGLSEVLQSNKSICQKSVDNVKPILESRKVRKGRVTYRVPLVTKPIRQEGKAISWLVESACSRKNRSKSVSKNLPGSKEKFNDSLLSKMVYDKRKMSRSLKFCLAEELLEAFQGKGHSVEKKKELHQIALQNRAYTHYRWW